MPAGLHAIICRSFYCCLQWLNAVPVQLTVMNARF